MPAWFSRSLRPRQPATMEVTRFRFALGKREKQQDQLAIEEPLEITLEYPKRDQLERFTLAITMRTPGHDLELAAGFLFAEGIIKNKNDIHNIAADRDSANPENSILATLTSQPDFDPDRLQRYFFTNSSCGVCGKTSIQALEMLHQPELVPSQPQVTSNVLQQLPDKLQKQQPQFAATGSVHSAALFSTDGSLLTLNEDVGRHNAMDKLIGSLLLDDKLSLLRNSIILVSGRASFELVQKALMANIPILASIGAPTSLAHQLANRHGLTLAGFLKTDGFNIYSAPERIN